MAAYSFIDNNNDFFSTGLLHGGFPEESLWQVGYSQKVSRNFVLAFLRFVSNIAVTSKGYVTICSWKDKERETLDFNSKLLECLVIVKVTVKEQPTATCLFR